ncbi:MAG TPA: hypothetical protein VKU02_04235, partial [Gemmataceae bacterium]|nr:hypothetical protein [Gemmataceae bacterium]
GSILSTADGGQTWRVQQRSGQRAAVLFVHAHADGIPLETVAALGGEEGYLATGLRVLAPDSATAPVNQAGASQRFEAAVRQAGGAAGEMLWQFPLPQHLAWAGKLEILQAWNQLHADRATEELLRQIVLALRMWRPSVVVTDHPDEAHASPSEALLAEALNEAFRRAADPQAFPEQIAQLGLQPWEVAKLYCCWPGRTGAEVFLDASAISPRLEMTARDFAMPLTGLLSDHPYSLPRQRFYHLLARRVLEAASHRLLMQGIELAPGGVARRKQSAVAALAPELEKALQSRRNLQALAESPQSGLADPNRLLAQVGPMLAGLPDDQAAATTFALANQYVATGHWSLARELFQQLVNRYPAHPLAVDAYRWLIRHSASGEARRRHELTQSWNWSQTTIQSSRDPSLKQTASSIGVPERAQLPEGVRRQQAGLLGNLEETRRWYQTSLELGTRLAALGPLFATDPSIQFCLQAARRRLGDFEKAQGWYTEFLADHPNGAWHDAAAAELWLINRTGLPPRPVAYCRQTESRPFLDGTFDEPCWKDAPPLVLHNAAGDTVKDYPTEVRLTFDKDFLYVALRCGHPAGRYVAPVKPRPHDADLRPYDHVSLILDLDRDYSTYFRLEVDQRGCVCEDCWGDRTWDPHWYVALHSERTYWQVEAAIPLTELTADTVAFGRTWACNVVRVLPGRGVQAWSQPAGVEPRPEGMGLLMFLQPANLPSTAAAAEKPMSKAP